MNEVKRMTKNERRLQLLETAFQIIKAKGTDALTLATVAEQAGVTKPIAYEHFGTREGLLLAMYQDYDERQYVAIREALTKKGESLEDVAVIMSESYIDCAIDSGSEYGLIAAALSGSAEMEQLLQNCRDGFADECRKAFQPFIEKNKKQPRSAMIGIIGAAEFLSQAAATGRISRNEAVKSLTKIMLGSLV